MISETRLLQSIVVLLVIINVMMMRALIMAVIDMEYETALIISSGHEKSGRVSPAAFSAPPEAGG